MSEQERLLGDIRELTVEMSVSTHDLNHIQREHLGLVLDILKQIRSGNAPGFPIMEFIRKRYDTSRRL